MPRDHSGAIRIEEVRVTPVAFRDPPLLAASGMHEPWTARTILEVACEGGVTGLSETYGDAATVADLRAIAPRLAGLRVTDLAGLRALVEAHVARSEVEAHQASVVSPRTDRRLRVPRLFGAIETGMLDALARRLGVPLCELLGGPFRDRVPFAAYLFFKPARHPGLDDEDGWGEVLGPSQVVAEARRMIARHGFRALKLKGGVLDPDVEADCMEALARAHPGLPLRIDPNGNWSVETTRRLLPRFEGLLQYLEDPVLGHAGMAEIRAAMSMPMATNMCVTGFSDLPEAVRTGSVDVVLADHHFWGGLRATVELSGLCRTFGLGLSMHSNSHLGVSLMAMTHVAAACPNLVHDCDTHYVWTEADVLADGPVRFEDGAVRVPEGPGLGVELDPSALHAMAMDFERAGTTHRDDTLFIRRLWPDWTPERPRF